MTLILPRALGCRGLKPSQSKHLWILGGWGVLQLPPTSLGNVFMVKGVNFILLLAISLSLFLEVLKQKH